MIRSEIIPGSVPGLSHPIVKMNMFEDKMVIGGFYNWKYQSDRLIYLGKKGSWHQFKKIGDPREVWCEILTGDLPQIEETK